MPTFIIPGEPVSKPRQTQSDRWKQRPCVMKYRAWADVARLSAGNLPAEPKRLSIVAFFSMPKSWSRKKREAMKGQPHRVKPDGSNVLKAAEDALYPKNDSMIYDSRVLKMWSDEGLARVEVEVQ